MTDVQEHLHRLDEEREAVFLYARVAACERDPRRAALFRGLGKETAAQAKLIEAEIQSIAPGTPIPPFRASSRVRLVAWLVKKFGPRAMVSVLAAMKVRGVSVYRGPLIPLAGHPVADGAAPESWHKSKGGAGSLRAAVFGANDGLVSNASLILGMAGATADPKVVLLTGVAGLLAGASSMAAGEWISVKSQREMFEHQIGQEKEELALYPDSEAEELALIYEARGLSRDESVRIGKAMVADPVVGLDALAREELGLNPDDLGSPWGAAIASFLAFAIGALAPLAPFLITTGSTALTASIVVTAVALLSIGAVISLFTGTSALKGGLRMLLVGGGAGAATYALGRLFGVSVA